MSSKRSPLSRRDFLKTAGAAGVGTLLAGAGFPDAVPAAQGSLKNPLPVRPFGKTGVSVPILGLGGSQNLASKERLLRQAVKLGVTYWDTAESYSRGGSEEAMGRYLKKYPQDRRKLFLVTKSHSTSSSGLTESLNNSLERLRTSYVDLYFVHGISDPEVLDSDIRRWAEGAKAEGKIRFIGFSSHSNMEECMLGAASLGWLDGIMVTYNYRLMHTDAMKRAVEACVKAGIGLTAMKTQAGWSWGPVGKESETAGEFVRVFSDKGYSEEQAKLKAVWENPHIATICSEMTNLKILMSNVAAARNRTTLSFEDQRLMHQYARETASEYCAGCAALCESALEAPVPVSDTMRYLMYARCYREPRRASSLFRAMPLPTRLRMGQIDYGAAERACPQGMPIGRLMREALAELGEGPITGES